MTNIDTDIPEVKTPEQRRDSRRAKVASFLGTTVEFYDFLLYAFAAGLIFPRVFFAGMSPNWARPCRS